jgi:hypothetical protein
MGVEYEAYVPLSRFFDRQLQDYFLREMALATVN